MIEYISFDSMQLIEIKSQFAEKSERKKNVPVPFKFEMMLISMSFTSFIQEY